MMYLAIDIGGTNVRAAVSDSLESPEIGTKLKIPNNHDFGEYFRKVTEFALQSGNIAGVGISCAGDLDATRDMVTGGGHNNFEIIGQPVVKLFREKLNCPVVLENDAFCSGLGEATYGSKGEFIYLIWGTGIGGAVVKSEPLTVKQIDWETNLKVWEGDCGGAAILKKYSVRVGELTPAQWAEVMQSFEAHLIEFCGEFKPPTLVFGGGIALNHFDKIAALKAKLGEVIPEVALAKFGDDAGLMGAFALLKQELSANQ